MSRLIALCLLVFLGLLGLNAYASDHADPALPSEFDPSLAKEPNITGLFVFPKGDRLVLVYNVFRSLSSPPPYKFEDYEFVLYMDLHSQIDFSNTEVRARYGGEVVNPKGISPDATITIHISNDAQLADKKVEGLNNPDDIQWYVGVRDDPFIFTPFFGVNVVSMVMSIPMSAFPEGQQDWIMWGITRKKGSTEIIDHIGRGLRTQLPRFGFINTLPPSEHVEAINTQAHKSDGVRKFLMSYLAPATNLYDDTFAIRYYDGQPDVCIYTSRFPVLFPNGRALEDDIAKITCEFGDCVLAELAIAVGKIYPRPTVNDKPFSPDFPYLAEPWPDKPPVPKPSGLSPQWQIRIFIGLAIGFALLILYWLITGFKAKRKLKKLGIK